MTRRDLDLDNLSPVEQRALLGDYVQRQRARQKRLAQYEPTARELSTAQELRRKWFPQQAAFFASGAKRRCAFTTRRGGKTIGTAIWLVSSLLEHPTSLHLYMAQTAGICKLYMWNEIKRLILEYQLPFKTNETDLTIIHERGLGAIVLKGADKADEIEKLRGPKWIKAALDEAASFGVFIENLIMEVLGAALMDQGGELIMTGTAGKKKEGIFYEACHGLRRRKSDGKPVWELHKWSFQDNPFIPQSAKNEDTIIDDNGFGGPDDPRFLREFKGIWAVGESERVFAGFQSDKNVYKEDLPHVHDWRYLMGVDFGWHDESAISIVAYALTCRRVYVVDSWAAPQQFSDDVARQVNGFRQKYGQRIRIVGDLGGYGKGIAVHLQRDHGLYIEPAAKRDKLDQIAFINSAFLRRDLLVHEQRCKELIKQLQEVAWNASKTDMGNHERDDRAAAMLYAWRAAKSGGSGSKTLSQDPYQDPGTAFAIKEKQDALKKRPEGDPNEPAWLRGDDDPTDAPARIRPSMWREIVGL
jgi:hypothetical protein